jgi:hypothetical protein
MRWSAYIYQLAPADRVRLVNALTLGWGYTQLASQLAAADRGAAVILADLAQAAAQLAQARALLTPAGEPRPPAVAPAGPTSWTSWRGFLGDLPAAVEVEWSLAAAVESARQAALVARADGAAATVRRELDRALAALARLRRAAQDHRPGNVAVWSSWR